SMAGRRLLQPGTSPGRWEPAHVQSLLTLAWLVDADILLREEAAGDQRRLLPALLSLRSQPVTVYVLGLESQELAQLPPDLLLPAFDVQHLTHEQRAALLRQALGRHAAGLAGPIEEAAYRYRLEAESIEAVGAGLQEHRGAVDEDTLFAAL